VSNVVSLDAFRKRRAPTDARELIYLSRDEVEHGTKIVESEDGLFVVGVVLDVPIDVAAQGFALDPTHAVLLAHRLLALAAQAEAMTEEALRDDD